MSFFKTNSINEIKKILVINPPAISSSPKNPEFLIFNEG